MSRDLTGLMPVVSWHAPDRICGHCGRALPADLRHFYKNRLNRRGVDASACRPCKRRLVRERRLQRNSDPELRAMDAAYHREYKRHRLQTDDGRRRSREATRQWRQRLKADPERYAQYLADRRIWYRLRAERLTGRLEGAYRMRTAIGAYKANTGKANTVPVAVVEDWVVGTFADFENLRDALPQEALNDGALMRRLHVVEHGEQENISVAVVDRIGVLLGDTDLVNRLDPMA